MGSGGLDLIEFVLGNGGGAAPALVTSSGASLGWVALAAAVERAQRQLGEVAGCAIAVACPEPAGFLVASLGVLAAGAVLVPLHGKAPAAVRAESERAIGVAATVTKASLEGELDVMAAAAASRRFAADIALVLPTSGSSGQPKRVVLRGAGLVHNIGAILEYLPVVPGARTGVVLPLSYSYGLIGQCFTTLRAGGTVVLLADLGFATAQVQAMAALGVDGVSSVPASLQSLCRAALDLGDRERPKLDYVASAGGPLSPEVIENVRKAFPGATIFNQYGLTEASPRVTALSDREEPFARGSVGRAIAGVTVEAWRDGRVCPPGQTGEIVVRGPSLMLEYLDDAEATAAALKPEGLHTGDVGSVDEQGYVFLEGRNDDLVNVAGERISTVAVANALRAIDQVTDAFVVAVSDPVLGARFVAFVEASDAELPDIRKAARAALTPAWRPAKIFCVPSLPRGEHGKPDRLQMQAWAAAGRVGERENPGG